jgi:hypothetical protein
VSDPAWQPHEPPARTEYVVRLERVADAARQWIDRLESKGGHYRDGVPGELMDALDALDAIVTTKEAS